jgi:hypothetical protein
MKFKNEIGRSVKMRVSHNGLKFVIKLERSEMTKRHLNGGHFVIDREAAKVNIFLCSDMRKECEKYLRNLFKKVKSVKFGKN